MPKDYIFVQKKTYTYLFPNIYVIGRVYANSMRDLFGGHTFGLTLLATKKGVIYWYASESGMRGVAEKSLEIIKNDLLFKKKTRRKFESLVPVITALGDKLSQLDFLKLNDAELWDLMAE